MAAIFITALAIRLIHIWQIRRAPFFTVLMGDSRAYDEWAQRIAGGDWMGHEVFYQAPLYPYVLGLFYRVAGRSLLGVRIFQAVLGSCSCVLLAEAGRRWFSERVGIFAGFALAVYAPAIFFDGLIQKSTLDVFFVCLVLYLIAGSVRSWRSWLGLGVTMGALSLTRENALVLIVIVTLWALLPLSDGVASDRLGWSRAGWLVAGVAIVLAPVAARNRHFGGGFVVTTSQFGPNLYIGNHAGADGTYEALRYGRGAPEYERQDATELAERALGRTLSPVEVSGYWTDRALDFITSHPLAWLRLLGRKLALLCNAVEMVDTESQETYAEWSWPLRMTAWFSNFGVLVPLAVLGIALGRMTRVTGLTGLTGPWTPGKWPPRILLLILAGAYAASVILFYVFARYRFPLVPFLILFASAGALEVPDFIRRLKTTISDGTLKRRTALTVVAVVAAAAVSNWPLLSHRMMNAVTESNLGVALQAAGRNDEAVASYRRAVALEPNYAPVYSNLASTLRSAGRVDEAVSTYRHALELKPDFPDAEYNLANALLQEGQTDEAIQRFQVALRALPESADAHNNLGIALAGKGRAEEAAAQFRRALESDPNSVIAHRNLGDLLADAGDHTGALTHLRRAEAIDPNDGRTHYDLGSLLLEGGTLDEAIRELQMAAERLPSSAEARNNLGIALGSNGQFEKAILAFRDALRLRPGFADAQRNLDSAIAALRSMKSHR